MAHAEKCPVCNGNGLVSDGFYNQCSENWSSTGTFEKCRSCNGSGWITVSDENVSRDTLENKLVNNNNKD